MPWSPFKNVRSSNATVDEAAPTLYSASAPSNMLAIPVEKRIRIQFYGTTAADKTAKCALYVVYPESHPSDSTQTPTAYISQLLGLADYILGTTAGAATTTTIVDSDEYFADTITWTDGMCLQLEQHRSTGVVEYTPADNTVAELVFNDLGGAMGIVFRWYDVENGGGEADESNALYSVEL